MTKLNSLIKQHLPKKNKNSLSNNNFSKVMCKQIKNVYLI
jgi:hypothetical protein